MKKALLKLPINTLKEKKAILAGLIVYAKTEKDAKDFKDGVKSYQFAIKILERFEKGELK
ncbi:MAG: hypothetical protein WC346_02915 [Methanogenium sp.]|jgi:hypothetical protein